RARFPSRPPDDAPIDKGRATGCDVGGNVERTLRRNGIRIDIDALENLCHYLCRHLLCGMGRANTDDDLADTAKLGHCTGIMEILFGRALVALTAAPCTCPIDGAATMFRRSCY